jgi:hypothetical protein
VKVTDCSTLDRRTWTEGDAMIVPVLPPAWKAPSPHRDGSVAGFENQGTVIESSEGGAEFDQTVSQASH